MILEIVKPQHYTAQNLGQALYSLKNKNSRKPICLNEMATIITSITLVRDSEGYRHLTPKEFGEMPWSSSLQIVSEFASKYGTKAAKRINEKFDAGLARQQYVEFIRRSRIPRLAKCVQAIRQKVEVLEREQSGLRDELSQAIKARDKARIRRNMERRGEISLEMARLNSKLLKLNLALIKAEIAASHLIDYGWEDIQELASPLLEIANSLKPLTPLQKVFKIESLTFFEKLERFLARFKKDISPPLKPPLYRIPSIQPNSPNIAA
jgi:hypothetical protein